MLWLRYYERQTMATVVRGLEATFGFFGGVPSELLLRPDAGGRDHRSENRRPLENREFLRFSSHWGIRVWACRADALDALADMLARVDGSSARDSRQQFVPPGVAVHYGVAFPRNRPEANRTTSLHLLSDALPPPRVFRTATVPAAPKPPQRVPPWLVEDLARSARLCDLLIT